MFCVLRAENWRSPSDFGVPTSTVRSSPCSPGGGYQPSGTEPWPIPRVDRRGVDRAVLPRQRESVGGRAARRECSNVVHERAGRATRHRAVARGIPWDGGMGVRTAELRTIWSCILRGMIEQPLFSLGAAPDADLTRTGGLDVAVDETFSAVERIRLDDTSWVEHVQGWLTGDVELAAALMEQADWEQRSRWMYTRTVDEPRLTAEYPVIADAPQPVLPLPGRGAVRALRADLRAAVDELVPGQRRRHRVARRSSGQSAGRGGDPGPQPRGDPPVPHPPRGRRAEQVDRRPTAATWS